MADSKTDAAVAAPEVTSALALREDVMAMTLRSDWEIIVNTLCPGSTPAEAKFFLACCVSMGLDPRRQQAYFIKSDHQGQVSYNIYIATSHLRTMVLNSGLLEREEGPFFAAMPDEGQEPVWLKIWTNREKLPALIMVRSKRRGRDEMQETVRYWREVSRTYLDKYTKERKLVGRWLTHPLEAFESAARRKHYMDFYGDIVSNFQGTEEMLSDDERAESGLTDIISRADDAEIQSYYKLLGYTEEKIAKHENSYKANRGAALAKLKQEAAARGLKLEIPPAVDPNVVDAEFTEIQPEGDIEPSGEPGPSNEEIYQEPAGELEPGEEGDESPIEEDVTEAPGDEQALEDFVEDDPSLPGIQS